ncbi:hypothetical protein B0H16DRAFT_1887786 [Mycena metata]|uniref:Uncharacterized protein n=1 Tax=Mycena metata TaxID=1033252 RepID=A0AAD7IUB0_9AGAR|nr:hypothetical protein B0H16DRAFT_1887786 [Mycena metata]
MSARSHSHLGVSVVPIESRIGTRCRALRPALTRVPSARGPSFDAKSIAPGHRGLALSFFSIPAPALLTHFLPSLVLLSCTPPPSPSHPHPHPRCHADAVRSRDARGVSFPRLAFTQMGSASGRARLPCTPDRAPLLSPPSTHSILHILNTYKQTLSACNSE